MTRKTFLELYEEATGGKHEAPQDQQVETIHERVQEQRPVRVLQEQQDTQQPTQGASAGLCGTTTEDEVTHDTAIDTEPDPSADELLGTDDNPDAETSGPTATRTDDALVGQYYFDEQRGRFKPVDLSYLRGWRLFDRRP